MHLKTLSLVGFKSFADRTRLVFEPGVTVVVGPNGSGKSNLVDAVAWVLGTQATRSLRSEKMDDLIFAGTALRPAHGRSEVSLTFDNESGGLPLDLAEVTVTRRLHRDGTSEYEINGTPCRLLDIQELLADGGIGRHQHAVVGQGRLDTVLNSGPDEHRAVIEEAAGVIKHRNRRDRALRRLEATSGDVVRLHDLLDEQRRLMRPLKRQAADAERYQGLKDERRALRLWLGGRRLASIDHRLTEIGGREAEERQRLADAEARLDEIAAGLGDLQSLAGEVGRALQRDTGAAARLETVAERLQRIATVAAERRRGAEGSRDRADERRGDLESEREDLVSRLAAAAGEAVALGHLAERHEAALRALEDEDQSLAGHGDMPAEGVAAALRGDLSALEAADRRDRGEAASLQQAVAAVKARMADEQAEAARLDEEIREADRESGEAGDEYRRCAADRARAQAALENAEAAMREAAIAVAGSRARFEAIGGGPDVGDPVASAAGVLGPVVSRLDIPENLARAVDAALGSWGDAWALEGPAALAGAVGSAAGPVAVVVPSIPDGAPASGGILADLLGPGRDPVLAAALLGDVVLVDDWEQGWALIGSDPGLRAVTRDGDLVTRLGVRMGGGARGRAAREAAGVALERAVTAEARATSILTTARREFAGAREEERAALESVEEIETRIAGAAEALRLVERSRSGGADEAVRLEARRAAVEAAMAGRAERMAELRSRLADFEGEEAVRQSAWEALNRRRLAVAERRQEARTRREEAAAALAAVEERRRMLSRRLDQVMAEAAAPVEAPPDEEAIARLGRVEDHARGTLAATRRHLSVLRDRQRQLREAAGSAGSRLDEANRARADLEPVARLAREVLSTMAVEAAELRVRRESEAEGLRRDVDATEEEALAAGPVEVPSGGSPEGHLDTLDARLRRMGPVNPLAAAEYQELAERSGFLEAQLADLDVSRRDLTRVIAALDEEIGRLFNEAFAEIAAGYEDSFGMLFPGGRGRLTLTDPEDPLHTGVQVHAQPMGKRVSRLSLLSGGERSLAALAFLFAVFRARPSPFYVLDEVDAALDDANLHRFLRLVGTLREAAQLVIVTHQQQTMEAADLLYGVTMEPGETSRVLAKRINRAPVTSGDGM